MLQAILVPALSPLLIGCIRKLKAKLQNRRGAGIFQPYRDLWKLLHKDEVISRDASWITRAAPFVVFSTTLVVGASVPLVAVLPHLPYFGDLLTVVYMLSLGTFFLALAGMDAGGGFGGFGASREMTLAALAEGGFLFSLLVVALASGSTNLFAMPGLLLPIYGRVFLPLLLAFLGFFIVLLAENARFPFDNPSTHLELTMVHEAMILECSGKRLALMEWASANKLFIFSALAANLFFPWGVAGRPEMQPLLVGVGAFLVKMLVFAVSIAIIESTMAKFRFFRLPGVLFTSFILNVVAIGLLR